MTLLGTEADTSPSPCSASSTTSVSRRAAHREPQYYVGLLATTILFIATNAGLIGISRLSWSLSEHRQLPSIFSRLHPTYRTPWFTIVFFSGFAVLLITFASINALGNLYSFGAMLSFTTAHAAIVALRIKDPDRERPYRMPGNVLIRGRQIPITAVVGGIGTFAAWIAVVALHPEAKFVGIPWMVVGMAGYVVYRKRSGLSLPTASIPTARSARRTSTSSATARRWCRSSAPTSARRRLAARPS